MKHLDPHYRVTSFPDFFRLARKKIMFNPEAQNYFSQSGFKNSCRISMFFFQLWASIFYRVLIENETWESKWHWRTLFSRSVSLLSGAKCSKHCQENGHPVIRHWPREMVLSLHWIDWMDQVSVIPAASFSKVCLSPGSTNELFLLSSCLRVQMLCALP